MRLLKLILVILVSAFSYMCFHYMYISYGYELDRTLSMNSTSQYALQSVQHKFEEDNDVVYKTLTQLADKYEISFYCKTETILGDFFSNIYLYTNDFSSFEEYLPFVDYETIDFTSENETGYYTTVMNDLEATSHMYVLLKEEILSRY